MNDHEDHEDHEDPHQNAVAIVGLSGRFPKSDSVDAFWANLRAGVECIESYSEDTLLKAGVDAATLANPNYVRAGAVVKDIDRFDAKFFEMTASDAALTDPQHRLFLEVAWEALEMSGYARRDFPGLVGVYAGVSYSRYLFENLMQNPGLMATLNPMQLMIGTSKDALCSMLSYKLNLRGPAVTIQTTCSTSLVAVHTACQAILNGECDLALAGGVSLRNFREEGYFYAEGDISSPDGHCRTFDADAAGTIGGNGVGIVVLKKLEHALADGDTIHAVILGSAVNNDGSQKVGFTAPSVTGQMSVISEALAVAGVGPEDVSYIEAHGTGTILGDPIELRALNHVFATDGFAPRACAIGAVKTNIGHLDAAAGVAGLIKVTQALRHREIAPTLHFKRPNPNFDLANSPFYINAELQAWQPKAAGRIAGVSSFGIGGTNAHLIVAEAPPPAPAAPSRRTPTLLVSAKTPAAVRAGMARLRQRLADEPGISLADAAFTTQVGREHFAYRASIACDSVDDALRQLDSSGEIAVSHAAERGASALPVVFMFPGQGIQYAGMARELHDAEPAFARELDACLALFREIHALDLRAVLFPSPAEAERASAAIDATDLAQPAIFSVEYALARYLIGLGIAPTAMLGHSIGEYVAACLAGVFSLEDAVRLVGERGKLMARSPAGAMLAVHDGETAIRALLGADLWIAAVNSPASCAVSGTPEAIERLEATLRERSIDCSRLRVTRAFHSGLLESVAAEFRTCVERVPLHAPAIRFASNVTGEWITHEAATDPGYWVSHLLGAVRFADCAQTVANDGDGAWIEVGPGKTLANLVKYGLAPNAARCVVPTLPDIRRTQPAAQMVAGALGALWAHGVPVDWAALHAGEARRRIPLPTYAFERERHWIEASGAAFEPQLAASVAPVLGKQADVSKWLYLPSWRRRAELPRKARTAPLAGPVLVFGNAGAQTDAVVQALRAREANVVLVREADALSLDAGNALAVNPSNPEHYAALFAHLVQTGRLPVALLHLWSLSEPDDALGHSRYHDLLGLANVLGNIQSPEPISLTVAGHGVHAVLGDEPLRPHAALIAAACKVIPLEFRNLLVNYVDVVASELGAPASSIAGLLGDEVLRNRGTGQVALRGRGAWVEEIVPTDLAADEPVFALRDEGVYLVTGGLGGIGMVFAQHVADRVRAPALVLAGRTALPHASEWDAWLAEHGAEDAVSIKIASIRALERKGARVHYVAADLASDADVARLAERVAAVGKPSGIFHAAGVGDIALLHFRTREAAERLLAAKVAGTARLKRHFALDQLDFTILCGSVNGLCPTIGQTDYCAASAFLDLFAQAERAASGANVLSVDWGTWHETGMAAQAASTANAVDAGDTAGDIGILNAEGVQVFELLTRCAAPRIVVSPYAFSQFAARVAAANAGLASEAGTRAEETGAAGVLNDPEAPTEARLLALWRQLFGTEALGVDDNFFENGGHSLLALQMLARIRDVFQVNFGLHNVFEAPTVALLTRKVDEAVAQKKAASEKTFIEAAKANLDGMSREALMKLLEEKRRAKASAN
ncbi:beta-ketoacyl synthase N-terminal-like domain-containing protein [Burkholderia sp. 22PA0099]|uniref:type I polyketide synthase n=1 Tax=Burkholderia sp. 22PA0099 TaxID=3237372 RepID=UPI0039C222C9